MYAVFMEPLHGIHLFNWIVRNLLDHSINLAQALEYIEKEFRYQEETGYNRGCNETYDAMSKALNVGEREGLHWLDSLRRDGWDL